MPALMKATLRFSADKRSEFEQAVSNFVPNLARTLGWTHRGVHWSPRDSLCTIEWELASVAELQRGQEFEQRPGDKPAWWTEMQAFVRGERIELQDDGRETCLVDTLG